MYEEPPLVDDSEVLGAAPIALWVGVISDVFVASGAGAGAGASGGSELKIANGSRTPSIS